MVYLIINVVLLMELLLFTPLVAADELRHSLPSRFHPCKKADLNTNRCPIENIDAALRLLREGIEELGVSSIDPMKLSSIEIPESGGPVSLGLKFTNVTVKGFASVKYTAAKFDFNDEANMSITFTGAGDGIQLESDYEMSGRMLVLPLSGKGHCKITCGKTNASVGPIGNMITLRGKKYFNVTHVYADLHSVSKVHFYFDNLFNGDKRLGSSTLQLINDNWQQVWEEMKSMFVEIFGSMYYQTAKRVFDRVPFDEIFLD